MAKHWKDEGSWFAWYPFQYRNDEKLQALPWQARGVWFELLNVLWTQPACKMKINFKRMANLIHIPVDVIKESWPDIAGDEDPLFEFDDDYFWSARLCEQRSKMETALEKMRAAGKKGAAKRYGMGHPKGSAMQEKEYKTSSNSFSSIENPIESPIGHPKKTPATWMKELHAEANQEADNLINQSGSIGMYGTPEGRNEITLQVMKKGYFSWSTICNLQQGTTPKWKAAFVDEYKRQFQKKGKTP